MKYPACNFAFSSAQKISNVISCRQKNGDPFSLIRLGDGEGLLLSISDQSNEADFKYLTKHFGAMGVDLDYLLGLKNRLIQSIKGADIIGVRDDIVNVRFEPGNFSLPHDEFLKNFRSSFRLREVEKNLDFHGSRRIAFLHKSLSSLDFNDDSQFCSAWFHYDYHNSGEIFKLLRQQKKIGLISSRQRLPGLLEKLFDISVRFHEIPGMFRDIPRGNDVPNYVEQLENILSQKQLVEFPGMLYLVGGGLYGKLYCQLIKSQGGMALDLGSLFDAWLGIPSRPTVYRAMYNIKEGEKEVPSTLLLTARNIISS